MGNVTALLDIFKHDTMSNNAKVRLILVVGEALNREYGMNWTEQLVFELISMIDKNHNSLKSPRFDRVRNQVNEWMNDKNL